LFSKIKLLCKWVYDQWGNITTGTGVSGKFGNGKDMQCLSFNPSPKSDGSKFGNLKGGSG
jgi:tyrosyl-tRNA synthetase